MSCRPNQHQPMLQDRITSDGRLITDPQNRSDSAATQSSGSPAATTKRPAGVPLTAPATPPISDSQLAQLVDFVTSCKRLVVLTGAGCSTESNIPDYRGPKGAYSTGFQPMTHQQVQSSAATILTCDCALQIFALHTWCCISDWRGLV